MVSEIFPTSPTYFQIQLQNDSFNSYVAGQTIIGRVVVELKDKLKVTALQIELLGKGVVRWEKEHYFVDHHNGSRRFSRSSVHFPSRIPDEETYIYQKKYLVGERTDSPVILSPGVHSFPYFFALSPWLPSSFEGRHCNVRYILQATLERALFKNLKSEPLKFEIKGILDLNQYPAITRPVNVSEHKNRDFLCWKLWSVAFNLNVERTGYVPEEILKFSVKFNNSCSNVKLTNVKAYLIQKVTVRAQRAESAYETKILKIRGPVINAGEIDTWQGQVEVPHVQPSGLGLYPSQVLRFNIQYYLKVSAKNVFSSLSRKVGLTIGTIPVRDGTTTTTAGTHTTSEVISFSGGHQFTPYQNLSSIFPPILVGANSNIGNSNEIIPATNSTVATTNAEHGINSESNAEAIDMQLNDQTRDGISVSSVVTENAKTNLKRTDTPPPSYEEAIKRPSARKP